MPKGDSLVHTRENNMSITKDIALDFFADLLPAKPKKDSLFETPVKHPKKMARRWKVTSVTLIDQVTECRCCMAQITLVNPHMLLTKALNDFDGKIIKTMETDCPEDSDMALITDETPVIRKSVRAGYVDVCHACANAHTPQALRALFASQVQKLKADPERRKLQAEKADKAEKELMDLIAQYDRETETEVSHSELDVVAPAFSDDLPY
jgi:hypothetical protein